MMWMLLLYLSGFLLTLVASIGISDLVSSIQVVVWLGQLIQSKWIKLLKASPLSKFNKNAGGVDLYIAITSDQLTITIEGNVEAKKLPTIFKNLAKLDRD